MDSECALVLIQGDFLTIRGIKSKASGVEEMKTKKRLGCY